MAVVTRADLEHCLSEAGAYHTSSLPSKDRLNLHLGHPDRAETPSGWLWTGPETLP